MPEYIISGIPVNFPFEPYKVQTDYMQKVIECVEEGKHGLLESPTGTGKTLSLLCSSLAWLQLKKAKLQHEYQIKQAEESLKTPKNSNHDFLKQINDNLANPHPENFGAPKIIYSSRTHSQLTQAMKELKRTTYNHVKAAVIGSRDQMCIHPEVIKETSNAAKTQLCKLKVKTRSCSFHSRVEVKKDTPEFKEAPIMDVEDLVTAGQKHKCCPYYMSKELQQSADIVFMPYNYLLDPKARRANKIELHNTIVILDEAHNVEKMCEESASVQIKSSEIAICIDDVTNIMKAMTENSNIGMDLGESKDFTVDDLTLLKEMLLSLETAVDNIEIKNLEEGSTFTGGYIFDLLQQANLHQTNYSIVLALLDNLIQYLTTVSENNFVGVKGSGLQTLSDLLTIVFADQQDDHKEKIKRCYKVHIELEETKQKFTQKQRASDVWQSKANISSKISSKAKIVSYWCFSPGFGMQSLLAKNVRSIILTSGTLAPLKPLISELSIPISVSLENPHIIGKSQICVKIISQGPDKEQLNSNYQNRDNPKYLTSLGRTILSFSSVVPGGMLIFFPSYPILGKCQESWQANGLWAQIERNKPCFVEPRSKDAFTNAMNDYYEKINDPSMKGAIFMAVCRGKVSEGLDFADINGRAVLITGLPFPPLKDPKVVLKKKYLQENRNQQNGLLTGDEWYTLEASRAVNQAIGRVIRHKDDYGAILLCDTRFNNPRHKNQLSQWIQGHISTNQQNYGSIGPIIGEVSRFFRNAERTLPQPNQLKPSSLAPSSTKENIITSPYFKKQSNGALNNIQVLRDKISAMQQIEKSNKVISWEPSNYKISNQLKSLKTESNDFMSALDTHVTSIDFNEVMPTSSLVTIHKRERSNEDASNNIKKKKFKMIANTETTVVKNEPKSVEPVSVNKTVPTDRGELLKLIKSSVPNDSYREFLKGLTAYHSNNDFHSLFAILMNVFGKSKDLLHIFKGMIRFIKERHENEFEVKMKLHLKNL